ncbi:MAG TPA: patatin-like phospholipase family protein, partial [Agriterribacter sp.]|nr:patatin-like phospholipase family protein [Agriterribacter sp.]
MRRTSMLLLLCPFFFFHQHARSQAKRPKVGLVLSGGAARGMAHIGILKAMEKAGLRPDYITGTSMGSIMGGLYAIGYSADQIDSIASNVKWDEILSNKVPMNKIVVEEKPFYGRYLIETPVEWPLKLKLPMGLLEGQNLSEMLFNLTRPVHNIDSFSRFPIPFACVATDISTGKPVVLNKGNLAKSLRASMAIPTIFTPVVIDDKLLVDGGLVRNFPVQEVIDMGADIVIGVFVSTDLMEKDELNSFFSLLLQSSWVLSAYDSRAQAGKVNYYIEPELTGISSGSFSLTKEIIAKGMETGEKYYPVFKKLADSLNAIAPQLPPQLPDNTNSYILNEVKVIGNHKIPAELITGKLKIDKNAEVSADEIEKKVSLLFGTGYFDNVGYQLKKDGDQYDLIVIVKETSPGKIKAAIHYDTENKAGINFNYTLRNALLPNSRIILEADLAEFPRINLNYLKYLGRHQRAAAMLDLHYDSFEPELSITNSNKKELYTINQYSTAVSLFTTNAVNHSFGASLSSLYLTLKPQSSPDPLVNAFDYVHYSSYKSTIAFRSDDTNERYYPKRGMHSEISASYFFGSSAKFKYENDSISLKQGLPASDIILLHGDITRIFPATRFLSVYTGAGMSTSFLNQKKSVLPDILADTYFGGVRPR